MAISQKITDLISLALSDRVLTFKERRTIVDAAISEGTPLSEINAVIDKMLTQRLKSYTKEELRSCPGCGHGVPLISDNCPYCGTLLEHQETPLQVPSLFDISGKEASIIRGENTRVAEEHKKNCPKCGAAYPLVSNICEYCGYILHEQRDSVFNIKKLIEDLKTHIKVIQRTLRPSFLMVLKYRASILCLYLLTAFSIFAYLYDNQTWLCIALALMPISILLLAYTNRGEEYDMDYKYDNDYMGIFMHSLFGYKTTKTPIDKADDQYYKSLYALQQYQRQIDTIYGKDAEAKQLLAEYAKEINSYKRLRNRNRNLLVLLFVLFFVPPAATIYYYYWSSYVVVEQYQDNSDEYASVYQTADFSKSIPCTSSNDYVSVNGNADLHIDVLHPGYFIKPEDGAVEYNMRISGVHLVSTGKKHASLVLQGALADKNGDIVGLEFAPYEVIVLQDVFSYQEVVGKGEGDIYIELQSQKSTISAQRLMEVADSASYFLIY